MKFLKALSLFLISFQVFSQSEVFRLLNHGTICESQMVLGALQRDCKYKIGDNVSIALAGVGESEATVTFQSIKGEVYTVKFQVSVQCILVRDNATMERAFISLKDGKVYDSTCPKS